MGWMERDQISDIRPLKIKYQISRIRKNRISGLKNQISDIKPPKKIYYQISHPLRNQISDINVPPFHPPPPPMSEGVQPVGCSASRLQELIISYKNTDVHAGSLVVV